MVWSQIVLNRIFANEGTVEKGLGHSLFPQVARTCQ